jgi:hypothetical protein
VNEEENEMTVRDKIIAVFGEVAKEQEKVLATFEG